MNPNEIQPSTLIDNKRYAYVFFATADWGKRPSKRALWRILRRRPRKIFHWWLRCLVRFFGRSRLAHVAIGDGEVVIDPRIQGNAAWPMLGYIEYYPTLVGFYPVPISADLGLDRYPLGKRKRVWPTLLRWWSGGRWRTDDCVCVTVESLRRGGVDVPARIFSPRQLFQWLDQQGYRYERLESEPAGPDAGPAETPRRHG